VDQHEAHLHQDLELAGDRLGAAVVEALGAVAALEQERLAAGGAAEVGLERLDLPCARRRAMAV
jgi:hypothetical protein